MARDSESPGDSESRAKAVGGVKDARGVEREELQSIQDGVVSRAQVLACGEKVHDIRRQAPATRVGDPDRRDLRRPHRATDLGSTGDGGRAARGVRARRGGTAVGRCVGWARRVAPRRRSGVAAWERHAARGLHRRAPQRAPGPWLPLRSGPPTPRPGGLDAHSAPAAARRGRTRSRPRRRRTCSTPSLVVADACQSRVVDAVDVRAALGRRERVPGRRELAAALSDVATGTCSALEHLFLVRVVRAHGLPEPTRQVLRVMTERGDRRELPRRRVGGAGTGGRARRQACSTTTPRQRDRDLQRDLDDVTSGRVAVRLGWGQVSRRACLTARRLEMHPQAEGLGGDVPPLPDCQ